MMPFNNYRRDLMGKAVVEPKGEFTVGSWGSFTLTYTAGKFGIDDRGSLKVALRGHADSSKLQTDDPSAPGYVTVEASNGAKLEYSYEFRRNIRPWNHSLFIRCLRYLNEGDKIIIRLGDKRQGSPGIRLQTIVEETFEFRFFVDPFACYDFIPLPDVEQPVIAMVPGEPVVWKAVWPTLRRPGEPFRLSLKTEDRWGNPTNNFVGQLKLSPSIPVNGLPESITFKAGEFSYIVDNLSVTEEDIIDLDIFDSGGNYLCSANPLLIRNKPYAHFWSDMHGQSEETIGTNSARDYFLFGRDKAFLDICAHQGNDFQITDTFWQELNDLTAEFDTPGRFLAVPGYEWSGNTSLGGDHNVWYRNEGRPIFRSCRALIEDRTFPENDCHTSADLFEKLRGEDAIVVAHVGGRYADVKYAHDADLEPSVEVHSSWGTFEWIVRDALEAGYKIGIVASSDGHKGRPGASYPGPASFGSYGGLTCHQLPALTRDDLFSHFRKRHHYATTGARIFLDITVSVPDLAQDEYGNEVAQAQMGSVLATSGKEFMVHLETATQEPIERIDIFDGVNSVHTVRPWKTIERERKRLRLVCSGQEYRGRGRMVSWDGTSQLSVGRIARFQPFNFWNPDRQPRLKDEKTLEWKTVTTGGSSGIDIWLDQTAWEGQLHIDTNQIQTNIDLQTLGEEILEFECGGMDKKFSVQLLPDQLKDKYYHIEKNFKLEIGTERRIYARVTQEDGHQAWSSPIYLRNKN